MSAEAKLIALLLAFAGVFGIGCRYGLNVKQGEWDAAVKAESESKDKALQAAAQAIAQINVTQQTIVQKVQHEIQTKTVYRDCIVPDDGRGLLNAAISSRGESVSGDGVQAPTEAP